MQRNRRAPSGLILRRLIPPARIGTQFDNELVKMTGIFMRKRMAPEAAGRYHLLEEIWALPSSF
ncbi:MAG: hypothetical protein JWR00_1665 [Rubritepida sp.]|nr:hypothetical protein [Rubritepida sp.]